MMSCIPTLSWWQTVLKVNLPSSSPFTFPCPRGPARLKGVNKHWPPAWPVHFPPHPIPSSIQSHSARHDEAYSFTISESSWFICQNVKMLCMHDPPKILFRRQFVSADPKAITGDLISLNAVQMMSCRKIWCKLFSSAFTWLGWKLSSSCIGLHPILSLGAKLANEYICGLDKTEKSIPHAMATMPLYHGSACLSH